MLCCQNQISPVMYANWLSYSSSKSDLKSHNSKAFHIFILPLQNIKQSKQLTVIIQNRILNQGDTTVVPDVINIEHTHRWFPGKPLYEVFLS